MACMTYTPSQHSLGRSFFVARKRLSRCFPMEVHVIKLHLVGTGNRIGILQNKEKQKFYMLFSDIDTILQPAKGNFMA